MKKGFKIFYKRLTLYEKLTSLLMLYVLVRNIMTSIKDHDQFISTFYLFAFMTVWFGVILLRQSLDKKREIEYKLVSLMWRERMINYKKKNLLYFKDPELYSEIYEEGKENQVKPKGDKEHMKTKKDVIKMQEMVYTPHIDFKLLYHDIYKNYEYCIATGGYHPIAYIVLNKEQLNLLQLNINKEDDEILLDQLESIIFAHGGITWHDNRLPRNYIEIEEGAYVIGWDYSWSKDYSGTFELTRNLMNTLDKMNESFNDKPMDSSDKLSKLYNDPIDINYGSKKWTTKEVNEEIKEAIDNLVEYENELKNKEAKSAENEE